MDPRLLTELRALVDLQRLRIVARLAAAPADLETLAADLRRPAHTVRRNLDLLVAAGLVEVRGGTFAVRADRLGELARALAAVERDAAGLPDGGRGGAWPHDDGSLADAIAGFGATPEEAKVLRSFLVDGRLATIPARGHKRLVILRFLLERVFVEDRPYPEKEVNQRLALFHPDVAALRRYLVDEGLVDREARLYRRRGRP